MQSSANVKATSVYGGENVDGFDTAGINLTTVPLLNLGESRTSRGTRKRGNQRMRAVCFPEKGTRASIMVPFSGPLT